MDQATQVAEATNEPSSEGTEEVSSPLETPAKEAKPTKTAKEPEAEAATAEVVDGEVKEPGEKKEPPKKRKIKLNGKDLEVTEEELERGYGLTQTAHERLKEASAMKAEASKVMEEVKGFMATLQKPEFLEKFIKNLGDEGKKVAKKIVLHDLEYARMTPEQRAQYDKDQELSQREAKIAEREALETKKKEDAANSYFVKEIDTTIADALKLSKLPPKPKTIARLAEACQTLIKSKPPGQVPSAQEVADKVRSQLIQDVQYFLSEAELDSLQSLGVLTNKDVERITAWQLDRSKKNLPSFGTSQRASTPQASKKKEKEGIQQFFKRLGA